MSYSFLLSFSPDGSQIKRIFPLERILNTPFEDNKIDFPAIGNFPQIIRDITPSLVKNTEDWSKKFEVKSFKLEFVLSKKSYKSEALDESFFGSEKTDNYTEVNSKFGIMARSRPEFEPGEADAERAQLEQVERVNRASKSVARRRSQKPNFEFTSVYHYFQLFDEKNNKPFFSLRSDPFGEWSELLSIEKKGPFRGNHLKEISDRLADFLGLKKSLIHDSSKKYIQIGNNKSCELFLREFHSVASAKGDSWYDTYSVMDLTNVFNHELKKFTQSSTFYFTALELIRNTTLAEMLSFTTETDEKNQKIIKRLQETYQLSENKTIHDLAEAINIKSHQNPDSIEIGQDLIDFQALALTDYKLRSDTISEKFKMYNFAVSILRTHYIWYKEYNSSWKPFNYEDFILSPHQSLNDLIGDLDLPLLLWETAAPRLFKKRTVIHPPLTQLQSKKIKFDETPWYDSPDELFNICTDISLLKKSSFEIEGVWKFWITINNNDLLIEFESMEEGTQFSFYEKDEANAPLVALLSVCHHMIYDNILGLEEFIQRLKNIL